MVSAAFLVSVIAAAFTAVLAAPAGILEARQSVVTLSASQIASYRPYTHYAGAAYCNPANTLAWNCGARCNANSGFTPIASGGNGGSIQFWYVGYDSNLRTVIVAYQGTDPSNFLALLTNADFFLDTLNTSLFPGVPSSVKVHNGFRDAHARSASAVISATRTAISRFGATSVTVVGHSLGGALATLGSLYLRLNLPSNVSVRAVTYGMPRVGNPDFANFYNARVPATRINNKKDPIPIVPGRGLGFAHTQTEIHITESSGAWVQCGGQDNTASQCTIGEVPNIFVSDLGDHSGPFDGIMTRCE
ncbi:hypothetical protein AX16_004628 [Volvariella volvacea WC 439]|nr:hypothetical protein AX16_004628 [Volvariella volvacea WC 439]